MSNMGDSVRNKNNAEDFLEFVSFNEAIHLQEVTTLLGSFVENGFLKKLFDKGPQAMDKAQLLVEMFGECANPNNFTEQAKATNIQPTTLSLLFTIAVYVSSRLWDSFGDDTESDNPSVDEHLLVHQIRKLHQI
ncbi:hypothetical protein RhiirA4_484673, partial [Rhizophagus irregularis]